MKTVKVTKVPFEFGGYPKNIGDQIEVADHVAKRLEEQGRAVVVAPSKPKSERD